VDPTSLDRPLKTFARARLDARQNDAGGAVRRLDSLLEQHPGHGLVDGALVLKGDLLREAGRADSAASAYLRLGDRQPESPLADRSLFQAADLYIHRLRQPERGIELLTRLLNEYPGSPFQQAARDRIRRLRREA
jgi:predicted Zn-dependent protease